MPNANHFPGRPALRVANVGEAARIPEAASALQTAAVQQAKVDQKAQSDAISDYLVHLGNDSVFDIAGYIRNPVDLGGPTLPTTLLSFLVPSATVLKINKIGITYSNPLVAQSQCVGWRITLDGGRVPYIIPTTDEYFYSSFGEVNNPLEIEPLWVQAQVLVAIEVYPRFGFNNQLTLTARLAGRLYKPATPEIIGI